jgi:cullin-associated NEDD8-dissociated protein 1
VLKVLLERLRNDITRLPSVKAFDILAHSPLELGLDDSLESIMVRRLSCMVAAVACVHLVHARCWSRNGRSPHWVFSRLRLTRAPRPPMPKPHALHTQAELTSFLRKSNRQLRQATLTALDALVAKYGQHLQPQAVTTMVPEAAALITDTDLSLAALSLKLCGTLCKSQPSAAQQVVDAVLPAALALVRSPLLQVRARVCSGLGWASEDCASRVAV